MRRAARYTWRTGVRHDEFGVFRWLTVTLKNVPVMPDQVIARRLAQRYCRRKSKKVTFVDI